MKIAVRALVIALALTGAVATAHANASSSTTPVLTKSSAAPIPTCPLNDPNGCGFGNKGN
jgi:hypothetical protein